MITKTWYDIQHHRFADQFRCRAEIPKRTGGLCRRSAAHTRKSLVTDPTCHIPLTKPFQSIAHGDGMGSGDTADLAYVAIGLSADVGGVVYVKNRSRLLRIDQHCIRQTLKHRSRALITTKAIKCVEHTSPKRDRMGGLSLIKGESC